MAFNNDMQLNNAFNSQRESNSFSDTATDHIEQVTNSEEPELKFSSKFQAFLEKHQRECSS